MKVMDRLLFGIALLTASITAEADTIQLIFKPVDTVPGPRLISAVNFANYVWLNYSALGVERIDPKAMALERLDSFGADAVSIAYGGNAFYLTDTTTTTGSLDIYRLKDAAHAELAGKLPLTQGARTLGVLDCGATLCVVTSKNLYVGRENGFKVLQLVGDTNFSFGGYTFGASTSDGEIYVGFDRGEWGGGLYKIDLTSGDVEPIQSGEEDFCEGLLKTACSPVTFVQRDSENGKCVLVATGLVHFDSMGSYLRVCGEKIETLFTHSCDFLVGAKTIHTDNCYAVFGVSTTGSSTWLSTSKGLIKLDSKGNSSIEEYPKLSDFHGLALSRDIPGLWVMTTDANAGYSVSGYTPLIVSVPQ